MIESTMDTPAGLCACGCGYQVKAGRVWLKGHKATRSHSVVIGNTYGDVVVLAQLGRRAEPSGHRRMWFRVRCACGREYDTCGEYLHRQVRPRCGSCGRSSRLVAKVGQRFDKLVVTGYDRTDPLRTLAVCRCDCGGTLKQRGEVLHKNKTNNCGCDVRGHWEGCGDLSMTMYGRVLRNAAIRGLTVDVSIEFLWRLYLRQNGRCALSGLPIFLSKRDSVASEASVDRIDSALAYTETNVQWVHKEINMMKQDLSEARFFELCQHVAQHQQRASSAA